MPTFFSLKKARNFQGGGGMPDMSELMNNPELQDL
jgi:hypothetical protein